MIGIAASVWTATPGIIFRMDPANNTVQLSTPTALEKALEGASNAFLDTTLIKAEHAKWWVFCVLHMILATEYAHPVSCCTL